MTSRADAQAAGQPAATVLSRLGEPGVLAKAYLADYHLQQSNGLRAALRQFSFFATTSLISLVVVPVLGMLVAFSAFTTLLAPFALVMRLAGVPGYMVGWNAPMPIPLAIPVALLMMLIAGLLTRSFFKLAQRYFRSVATRYHNLRNLDGA